MNYHFTTIIHKEGQWYVAQAIELGVASQGKTITEAKANLTEAVELYLEDEPELTVPQSTEKPILTSIEVWRGQKTAVG